MKENVSGCFLSEHNVDQSRYCPSLLTNCTSGGNNFYDFPENQLTKRHRQVVKWQL